MKTQNTTCARPGIEIPTTPDFLKQQLLEERPGA